MKPESRPRGFLRNFAFVLCLVGACYFLAGQLSTLTGGGFFNAGSVVSLSQTAKFDGKVLYRAAFEAIRDNHKELADPVKRAAWEKEWEHKFDTTGDLNTEAGADAAVAKMMESLGQRFDYFMNVEATKAEQQSVDATLVGIGVNVQLADMEGIINSLPETVTRAEFEKAMTISKGHELTVEGTVEGGPAAAVLKAGDIITHVDGKALDGMQLNDAVKLIRGQEGTTVNLTVERVENGNTQTLQVQVKRAKVKMKVVHTKDLGDGITYVRVDNFMSRTVAQEFAQALQKASTGKGLVIDLRGNPGGELNSVLAMSAMIIPDGTILVTESRESGGLTKNQVIVNRDFVTMVEGNGVQVGPRPPLMVPESMQIVVLIDGGSASASEILSGAIQVHSRGVVMGKPSHGKGVGQSVIDLPFGRRLHVTSFEFLPGGKAMDWIGILPEVEVENDPKQAGDEQLNAGVARLKTMIADEEARQKKSEELKKQNQDNFQKELQQRNQKRSEALSNQR